MTGADGTILYKDWLPDQPELNNPGLTEAQNALPVDGTYRDFRPLSGSGTASPARPHGAMWSSNPSFGGLYLGTLLAAPQLYRKLNSGYTLLSAATAGYSANTEYWRFAQFDDQMIATNYYDAPQGHTLESSSNFSTLGSSVGTAPAAQQIGVIGQFVVLGNIRDSGGVITYPHRVQWSSIGQPRNWPTPGSSTAIAQQSGQEDLNPILGAVGAICGTDQFGIVLQQGGLTRMTYVGGNTVFQFDEYNIGQGIQFPNSAVQVGSRVFYISTAGFCVTDGASVAPIGNGRVDRYFRTLVNHGFSHQVRGAVDYHRKLIYWAFCSSVSGSAIPDELIIYNYEENRWSRATNTVVSLTSPYFALSSLEAPKELYGWLNASTLGTFSGAPGSAVFTSAEIEPQLGGFSRVKGVKALVDQAVVTVAMGTRNDRTSAVSYTSETTANSRSGFADFRTEARYHRARVTVTGTFNSAQGFEYDVALSGAA